MEFKLSEEEFDTLLDAVDYAICYMDENGYRECEKRYRVLFNKLKSFKC